MIKTHLVSGTARYAKLVGAPRPGFGTEPGNGPEEWSFDLVLDAAGKETYLKSGADKFYIRKDKETGAEYVRFTRKALKQDGTEAKPIRLVDHKGQPWDGKTLIGNGSELNVSFSINEIKHKGQKRLKPSVLAVQVWDLKEYIPKSEFKVKEDAPAQEEWDGN